VLTRQLSPVLHVHMRTLWEDLGPERAAVSMGGVWAAAFFLFSPSQPLDDI
jgi:hypothetical protein